MELYPGEMEARRGRAFMVDRDFQRIDEWIGWPPIDSGDQIFQRGLKLLREQFLEEWEKHDVNGYDAASTPENAFSGVGLFAQNPELKNEVATRYQRKVADLKIKHLIKDGAVKTQKRTKEISRFTFNVATGKGRYRGKSFEFRLGGNPYKIIQFLYERTLEAGKTRPVAVKDMLQEAGVSIKDFNRLYARIKKDIGTVKKDGLFTRSSGKIWIEYEKIDTA